MNILTAKEFLKKPPGTVFQTFFPNTFGPLSIKGKTIKGSYETQDIPTLDVENDQQMFSVLADAWDNGSSFRLDLERVVLKTPENGDRFAVWEYVDLVSLVNKLVHSFTKTHLSEISP